MSNAVGIMLGHVLQPECLLSQSFTRLMHVLAVSDLCMFILLSVLNGVSIMSGHALKLAL